tara:strand:+ start:424 stop:1116 length:693 start_codon:yes stop_codon:yes gene_type:complete
MNISVIIPVYNEEKTILEIVEKVLKQEITIHEIIIVDDNSSDGTKNKIIEISSKYKIIKSYFKETNQGKGSAIKKGIEMVTGDIVIFQDADLEYNPEDYKKLIIPFKETDAQVVYGTRFLGGSYARLHFFWHYVANKLLTLFCNILTNLNMSDMETGYKLFKADTLKSLNLKENSFGIEPEITIKLSNKKLIFYEVPISYQGRSYQEGKKIRLKDAFVAVYCLIKYKFFN